MFYTFLIIIIITSVFLLNGCTSKPTVRPKKPSKATHGSVFKADDYSQSCTWELIVGRTKKRCVRK